MTDLAGKRVAFFGAFLSWPRYHAGSPAQVARRHGAVVVDTVDTTLGVVVAGDGRGKGRADAIKKAKKLAIPLLDEAGYRELLVGLAHAGVLVPESAHAWIRASVGKRPKEDHSRAAEAFLQYKGAEAGEVDWRPTETVPEDFYAF